MLKEISGHTQPCCNVCVNREEGDAAGGKGLLQQKLFQPRFSGHSSCPCMSLSFGNTIGVPEVSLGFWPTCFSLNHLAIKSILAKHIDMCFGSVLGSIELLLGWLKFTACRSLNSPFRGSGLRDKFLLKEGEV